jgi:GNAT superfamily N-acetyltransferase
MRGGSPDAPAGIVFRRLHGDAERAQARSLLAAGGRSWSAGRLGGLAWFGLWDLAAADGVALLGAAATRPVTVGTAELCALAVPAAPPWQGLADRLLREVADALRAQGVERMVARPGSDHGRLALLRDAGLAPLPAGQRPELPGAWLSLEL